MTSYSGLVLLQALIAKLELKKRFRKSLGGVGKHAIYEPASILMLVLLLVMLGFRRLRELDYCREEPILARVAGLRCIPDVATVSRQLEKIDEPCIEELRENVIRALVLERLETERFARITLDFDGSVQSTSGHAEGTEVGFNKRKKGARSYYPLFCTVAQTAQFFDLHHRSGNVHDSNGASAFMSDCFQKIRERRPKVQLESRFDSAFYNESVFRTMARYDVEFTCSVPFERFPALKEIIENCTQWQTIDDTWSSSESIWKPKCWEQSYRLLFVRKRRSTRTRKPVQLDLFIPMDVEYEYTVIATNKKTTANNVVSFHHGRGSQEKLFGEAKQHAALDVVVARKLNTNRAFTLMGMLAHNLSRELQMATKPQQRRTLPSRAARWVFRSLGTIRQLFLHRAGRLSRPQGELTLTLNANDSVESELRHYLSALATHPA